MNNIFEPLRLARGSHSAGSGKGCAMNVISWENGDKTITDYPECSDGMLAQIVQGVNDRLAGFDGFLSPENSLIVLDLGHRTVGTAYHNLDDLELKKVYVRLAVHAARKVVHLARTPRALTAIEAAEAWVLDPSEENRAAAAAATYAGADAAAAAAAAAYAADAADAADAAAYAAGAAGAYAAYAAYAAGDAAGAENQFRIDLAHELITMFKDMTGTRKTELPVKLDAAVRMMQEVSA